MFDRTKKAFTDAITPTKENLTGLRSDLASRLSHQKAHRSATEQRELEEDFGAVLQAWGIQEREIPHALRMLRLRAGIFLLPLLPAALLLWQAGAAPVAALAAVLCLPVSMAGVVTTVWRMRILKFRQFIPFTRWLCHACSLNI